MHTAFPRSACMREWQRDWAAKEVKSHCRAYGVGVEYADTMGYGAL